MNGIILTQYLASRAGMMSSMLKRSKLAVSGVAQSGHDIAHVVEAFVQRGDINIDVGMRLRELEQAVGSGDDADVAEARDSALFLVPRRRTFISQLSARVKDWAYA